MGQMMNAIGMHLNMDSILGFKNNHENLELLSE
jgi:hypothetical protein